jgi:hypothetical protein
MIAVSNGTLKTYLEERKERCAELLQNMVDLHIQLVGLEKWAPSLEDGVCNLQNTNVDGRVGGRQLGNEVLDGKQTK